ncbi:MAG: penicillin-binding protein 2 [Clostridiales Family XIII bacterium]|jgi:cell division protein FtsI (penicillin-binding protein 3)|nr:penicillin-binding protein 2 [Clostridiales Family XIII bacterium]
MGKKKNRINRKSVLAFAIISIFFLLFAKLVYLQIFLHTKINNNVDKMVNRENVEIPKRGDILDAKGNMLATSVKTFTVFLDAKMIEDFQTLKRVLSENGIQIKEKRLSDLRNMSYIPIAFNVDSFTAEKIKKTKLKGVGFEAKYTRQYPQGHLLAHILGITSCGGNGLEGIEKICDEKLFGEIVKTKIIKDGRGRIIHNKVLNTQEICGSNIELSIDRNIQFIVEQELREAFEKYKAKKAICIVQDPKIGKILAMVSLPDFDYSAKIKDISSLRNCAISDIYEPGSTFKIITVAAALEEGKIGQSDTFYLENGKIQIAGHNIKDDHKIVGSATLSKAFEMSSNIAMIKIAQKLGPDLFYDYIRKFGFYSLTGIDLPGEAKGLLMDIKNWNALTLPNISFGQGLCVSPLQVINAFSALANDGILLKPFIIQKIAKGNSEEEIFERKEIRRVVSKDTAHTMKKLLKNVVDLGTGKSAKVEGYTVGGKTGTAQKVDPLTKTYSTKYYIASFCGMLPAINPEFVVLVIIDEPKGRSYYAASVASPVFAKISKRVAEYLCIDKDDVK